VIITSYFLRVSGVGVSVAAAKRDSLSFPRSTVDRCTAGCSRRASSGDISSANVFSLEYQYVVILTYGFVSICCVGDDGFQAENCSY
jgi:hypothetical protein